MKNVPVIIPFFKDHEALNKCKGHLALQNIPIELFVRDNSIDNIFYTCAVNEGLRKFCFNNLHDFVLVMNQDAYLTENCLEILIKTIQENPKCGIVTPAALDSKGQTTWFGGLDAFPWGQHRTTSQGETQPFQTPWANGACWLLRVDMVREIGLLDQNMKFICSDVDYSFTARARGWEILVSPRAIIEHTPGASAKAQDDPINQIKLRDQIYLGEKWLTGDLYRRLSYEGKKLSPVIVADEMKRSKDALWSSPQELVAEPSSHAIDSETPWASSRAPLLLCHGLAGDLLLASPTLRALQHIYGNRITLVCGKEAFSQDLFSLLGFEQRISIDFGPAWGEHQQHDEDLYLGWTFDVEALLPLLPPVDLVINLCCEAGYPFNELVRRLGVPSIGFHSGADVLRLPVELPPSMDAWERCFQAVRVIDPSLAFNNFAWLPRHAGAQQLRDALLEQLAGATLLVAHADTKLNKMWPLPCWKQLLAQLLEEDPQLHVILVGYPLLPLDCYGDHERLIDCRDLTLMASFEIVSMADWFIGIDSCMLHAADLARVPSVGIFTEAFDASMFGFRFSFSEALQGANPPDNVSVAAVKQAFEQLRRKVSAQQHSTSKHLTPLPV